MCGTRADAEDLLQEIFLLAYRKLPEFRGDSSVGTWLYRLAVNVALAKRQSHATYRTRYGGGDIDVIPAAARHDRPDIRVDMEGAMQRLPPGARDVFLLHDVEGYTHEEIATMLNVTAGTSKSQLHRARMSLRQYLG